MKNAASEVNVGAVWLQPFRFRDRLFGQSQMIDGPVRINPVQVEMVLREQTDRSQNARVESAACGQNLYLMCGFFCPAAADRAGPIGSGGAEEAKHQIQL